MARIRTFTSWGGAPALAPPEARFGPADLNLMQDAYETTFARYRPFAHTMLTTATNWSGTGTLVLLQRGGATLPGGTGLPIACEAAIYLDPADFALSPRAAKLRLSIDAAIGATAPTGTWTFSLKPVSSFSSSSGGFPYVNTLGTTVPNSDFGVLTTMVANTRRHLPVAEFDCPAAGYYAICMTPSVAYAGGSGAIVTLEYRLT